MRIRKQSKASVLVAICGVLLAGLFSGSSALAAGQIAAITNQRGQRVNANNNAGPQQRGFFQASQVFPIPKINAIVRRVSSHYQVDPKLIHAIIQVESNYDPTAVSSKGAMGLMQLIPSTARRFGVQNPFDPRENIRGGVSYLKYLLHLFGGNLPLSLAAYNAGEETVIRSGGIPAIPETEHYVRAITHLYHSTNLSSRSVAGPVEGHIEPIVRYVDSKGVIHFTNAE